MLRNTLLLALLAALGCSGSKMPGTATLVLFNGNFFTADSTQPHATAVAIRGDSIILFYAL